MVGVNAQGLTTVARQRLSSLSIWRRGRIECGLGICRFIEVCLRLQRDRGLLLVWFLPLTTLLVSRANKATTEAVVAYLKGISSGSMREIPLLSAWDYWRGLMWGNLHSGRASSHFFFRLLHVIHPVLVRLLKFLLRFLGSDWVDMSLWSLPYGLYEVFADLSSSGLDCS
jgi:hypothetical protein